MKPELDKKLCEDFPLLYRDRNKPSSESSMHFGFPGDGWHDLIRRLSQKLEDLAKQPGTEDLHAQQVKQKLGTLRFYVTSDRLRNDSVLREQVNAWIQEAEDESARTCETCGQPGALYTTECGCRKTTCTLHQA